MRMDLKWYKRNSLKSQLVMTEGATKLASCWLLRIIFTRCTIRSSLSISSVTRSIGWQEPAKSFTAICRTINSLTRSQSTLMTPVSLNNSPKLMIISPVKKHQRIFWWLQSIWLASQPRNSRPKTLKFAWIPPNLGAFLRKMKHSSLLRKCQKRESLITLSLTDLRESYSRHLRTPIRIRSLWKSFNSVLSLCWEKLWLTQISVYPTLISSRVLAVSLITKMIKPTKDTRLSLISWKISAIALVILSLTLVLLK